MAGKLTPSWRPAVDLDPMHVADGVAELLDPWAIADQDSAIFQGKFQPVNLALAAHNERAVFAPIPIGVDVNGNVVTCNMPGDNGRHVLVIGASGAGKTTCMHTILLGIAPRPHVAVVLVDPKEIDFSMWRRRSAMMALGEGGAVRAFAHVVAELNYRKAVLSTYNQLAIDHGHPPLAALPIGVPVLGQTFGYILVAVDEMETLTDTKADPAAKQRQAQLRRILRLGRALLIGLLSGSQRPSFDVVPLGIRDLHRTRIVFGTESPEQSKVGYGEGYNELLPYPPHRIRQIGEGFIRVDRVATHFQGYYPTTTQIAAGATRWPRIEGPASWPHVIEDDDPGGSCPLCGHDPDTDPEDQPLRRKARR